MTKDQPRPTRSERALEELRREARLRAEQLHCPQPKLRLRELFQQLETGGEA